MQSWNELSSSCVSIVLGKPVLRKGFGEHEQVSNLNTIADKEDFDFTMMDMFTKNDDSMYWYALCKVGV